MTLKAISQELGRPLNRRIVLEAIRQKGPITRTEIARRVGLTVQTVSTITSELQELGFVSLLPGVPKGRGFPAPSLEVNPEGGYACGIYITPRGLEGGLINLAGDILDESSRAVRQAQPVVALLCAPVAERVCQTGPTRSATGAQRSATTGCACLTAPSPDHA